MLAYKKRLEEIDRTVEIVRDCVQIVLTLALIVIIIHIM